MAQYVYLIADHDEYGSENMRATLDRSLVPKLFEDGWRPQEPEQLAKLLGKTDEELARRRAGHDLSDGWGGPQLFVVRLDESV